MGYVHSEDIWYGDLKYGLYGCDGGYSWYLVLDLRFYFTAINGKGKGRTHK